MKKYIFAAAAALMCFAAFADDAIPGSTEDMVNKVLEIEDKNAMKTQIIKPANTHKDLHPKGAKVGAEVEINYVPLTGEARFYYTCMTVNFDAGEALNTNKACLEDFAKENGFFHYDYQKKDTKKSFKDGRGMNMTTYTSFVKFKK